jgi:hypothetical protein
MPVFLQGEMRCPTCKARQEWSDLCRRCKCDLRLLYAAEETFEQYRQICLSNLHAGRTEQALDAAKTCHRLRPGPDTHRLMALCHLLEENWPDALDEWRRVEERTAPRRLI